tara:strand:+ start:59 stop:265 length:207 start_codon:yes stop_codon:yes gene_type:complete
MERSLKQKNCMEYCKFILVNNPQFKKEIVDYIKKSQYTINDNNHTNQKMNNIININSICNEAVGFDKD